MDLATLINRAALWHSDETAVIFQGRRFTFRAIDQTANKLAQGLAALGVRKGDRVAIVLDNCREYVETDLALYKGGFVRVALNTRLAPAELAVLLNDAEAAALIIGANYLAMVEPVRSQLRRLKHVIVVDSARPSTSSGRTEGKGAVPYEAVLADQPDTPPNVPISGDDLAQFLYTGGTTGTPKAAMFTHQAVIGTMLDWQADMYHLRRGDVVFSTTHLSVGSGYRTIMCWAWGVPHVFLPHFDVKETLETVQRERVTVMNLVGTTMVAINKFPDARRYDLSSLRLISYGTASVQCIKESLKLFGSILADQYGQTEVPLTISFLAPHDHVRDGSRLLVEGYATVGHPFTNVDVRVVDEQDREALPGQVGEIVVRSGHLMKGYWKKPEATAPALRNGWLHTADLGYFDKEGYLFLVGRSRDMIKSGGINIYPAEVEAVLQVHPAVSEAAVIGVPDPVWLEAVKAVVVLKPGHKATEAELIEHCKRSLAGHKAPKSVDFLDRLPRSDMGKVLKTELAAKYRPCP